MTNLNDTNYLNNISFCGCKKCSETVEDAVKIFNSMEKEHCPLYYFILYYTLTDIFYTIIENNIEKDKTEEFIKTVTNTIDSIIERNVTIFHNNQTMN